MKLLIKFIFLDSLIGIAYGRNPRVGYWSARIGPNVRLALSALIRYVNASLDIKPRDRK